MRILYSHMIVLVVQVGGEVEKLICVPEVGKRGLAN